MELFRIIKKDARRALRGCIGRTAAAAMIIAMAYLAISLTQSVLLFIFSGAESLYYDFYSIADYSPETLAVSGIMSLVYFFLMYPLFIGYTKLHFAFAEGKDESINTLFDMFSSAKKYFPSVFFFIIFSLKRILALLWLAPGMALCCCAYNFIPEGTATLEILKIAALIVSLSVVIVGAGIYLVFIQRWHLAPYYFISGNGIMKSFSLSVKASKGIRGDILRFKLSFIGWALLSFFILPLLWSVPYYFVSSAIYSKYLMEKYEHSLAQVPEDFEHGEPELIPDP